MVAIGAATHLGAEVGNPQEATPYVRAVVTLEFAATTAQKPPRSSPRSAVAGICRVRVWLQAEVWLRPAPH
jgi:hypothetical protein